MSRVSKKVLTYRQGKGDCGSVREVSTVEVMQMQPSDIYWDSITRRDALWDMHDEYKRLGDQWYRFVKDHKYHEAIKVLERFGKDKAAKEAIAHLKTLIKYDARMELLETRNQMPSKASR